MDKDKDTSRESTLILGEIYRSVSVEDLYMECLKKEFDYSIKFEYKLLPWIINKASNINRMVRWMDDVHKNIVLPMSDNIKDIMRSF
jgi:hypothetical protein